MAVRFPPLSHLTKWHHYLSRPSSQQSRSHPFVFLTYLIHHQVLFTGPLPAQICPSLSSTPWSTRILERRFVRELRPDMNMKDQKLKQFVFLLESIVVEMPLTSTPNQPKVLLRSQPRCFFLSPIK